MKPCYSFKMLIKGSIPSDLDSKYVCCMFLDINMKWKFILERQISHLGKMFWGKDVIKQFTLNN